MPDAQDITGFVLTGGESSRMGRDKATLPFPAGPAQSGLLGQHVAGVLGEVCSSVAVVGDPEKHACLGHTVIPDLHTKIGPLGGIEAALAASPTPWVLVAACDMPALSAGFLRGLVDELANLEKSGEAPDALLPIPPGSPVNPLCAIYHRRILPQIREAIASGDYKVTRALNRVKLALAAVDDARALRNANTQAEWDELIADLAREDEAAAAAEARDRG